MVQVLLLCGSVRKGSSNEAMLRLVQEVVGEPDGAVASAVFYEGLGDLPHFNPDLDTDPLPEAVAGLRNAIADADAVLICTPEYAGTLPGSFKNLLDWTVGGTEICDKPTGWINAANPGRGEGAIATLRTVLEYTGAAIVEDACVRIALADPDARKNIGAVLEALR
ncbi:NADPH-dependent FMN reductase [Catenulispora acidiphila DSM 44928]|uniref:NADPH-dependent FMN reductase n=1 Tax=Catenulispora acidiphila (strain DSM 44928 / JCM 14897 / NBRC 102108 / NRRL B-24433 / ID139908) TaxID=479433 RepID=C7Q440_CATAD|nr:NADPH-dependent FMN reductase [Catenulispora acidiphila]ACU69900.1 NADPH-dependent FMN reductase [Catenulispora acidiphila DSM 44928]